MLPAFPLFLPLCSPLLHCIEATLHTVTNGGGSHPKLGLKKQKTTAPISGVCPLLLGSLALGEAPYCVINSWADRPTWHGTEDSSRRPGRKTGRQPHAGAGKRNRRAGGASREWTAVLAGGLTATSRDAETSPPQLEHSWMPDTPNP